MVTGAAGGIGAATVQRFQARARRSWASICSPARPAICDRQADVTDEDALHDSTARCATRYGHIDVLFNNAGISPTRRRLRARHLPRDLAARPRRQPQIVFLCCKHGIPHLLETGGGSVINTASFVAVLGAATSQISYTAVEGRRPRPDRELAVEFARRNLRVNALCPGPVDTPLLRELYANNPAGAARRMVHVPMGRFAEPTESPTPSLPRLRRILLHHRLHLHGRRRHRRRVRNTLRPRTSMAAG